MAAFDESEVGTGKQVLHFSVSGEYLTSLFRERFWDTMDLSYEDVEKQFCETFKGIPQKEARVMLRKILLGQACLIGDTRDNSIGLSEKKSDNKGFDVFEKAQAMKSAINRLTEINKETTDMVNDILDREDGVYGYSNKQTAKQRALTAPEPVISAEEDARRQKLFDEEYGWLAPDGVYYPSKWGTHTEKAYEIVAQNDWDGDMWEWEKSERENIRITGYAGDFLVYEKGWILIDNPQQGQGHVTSHKPLTKAQKEFLFQYYTDRGRNKEASALWDDDN